MNKTIIKRIGQKWSLTLMAMAMSTLTASAQTNVAKGKVVDENGESIIGASIVVKNDSKKGTITDMDGNFSLPEVANGMVLEITYIGYQPQTIKYNGKALDVTLLEDKQVLNEVIVTGYGAVQRKNLTTAISKVKGDDVIKTGTTNMGQMLLGRAAGLQATMSSAQPGGGIDMNIRGGGQPLYVVDGVVMPTGSLEGGSGGSMTVVPSNVNRAGLADINPEDIESIEVLKDASAAIYGVNAANGVILITTKKGKQGKMKVSYDGSLSLVTNYKYLEGISGQDYMKYVNAFHKDLYLYNHQMAPYGPNAYDGGSTDPFTAEEIANAQTTDWTDEVLRNGSISSHNITLQGGTEKLSYYLSGNYYNQVGTVKKSDYERFILRANVGAQLTKWLKLTTTINYNKMSNGNGMVGGSSKGRGGQGNGSLASALAFPSYASIYDEDGNYNTLGRLFNNPYALNTISDRSNQYGFYANFAFDINIIPEMLSARLLYGYNKEHQKREVFIPSDVYYDMLFLARGSVETSERDNTTMEATLSFDHRFFQDKLSVNAVVGMGRYLNHNSGLGVAYNEINDAIGNDNIGAASGKIVPSSWRGAAEKRSQFGRASIDFLDRYVLSGTLRRDGTDKFFPNKKYAWFPSASVAWKIYNEPFMRDINWINMLKLRASYGVTGNDNLGSSLYGAYTAFIDVKFDQNKTSYTPYKLSSADYPNVTWEKTIMKNIGLDYSVLNDRINGSIDFFWNDITNMLGTAVSEGLTMFGSYPINGGHIRRYGWDATLNTVNVKTKDFQWNSVLTLSHYNSVWKERFPNYDYLDFQVRDDEPVAARYFYRTDGIINSDKSNMPASQPEGYQQPGCPIIKDINGDGEITVDDVEMANEIPNLYWGFGNTFMWKGFDLNFFIYSQLGLNKYNYAYGWASHPTTRESTSPAALVADAFCTTLNPNGTLPGIAYDYANTALPGGAGTDLHWENASFLRVRNITLGYTFKQKTLGALKNYLSSLRIYVDAQNPFTFTSFKYFDPEVRTGGSYKGDKAEYPMTRTFSVGLKVQF